MTFTILVIDDESILRTSLSIALGTSGYRVLAAQSGEEGLKLFERGKPDLILLDHWLPGMRGDEVLRLIREKDRDVPVIVMTAQGSIELAVNSMKLGAADFLVKPFELEQLENVVRKGLERVRLKKEVEWLRRQYQEKFQSGGIIAVSEKMKGTLELAAKAAQGTDTTVLIQGETGTGKELLAEYIHFLSPRSANPFVPLNCGAIPRDLFESEFFGYERGAFTGALEKGKKGKVEAAQGGTLFLDEVADLPPEAQVKVLRFLEQKEYFKVGGVDKRIADVRIIAASNRELKAEVEKGNFREDLYFRLNVIQIDIAPLRDRKEDILALFNFFIMKFNEQFNKHFVEIAKEAQEQLLAYPWPGNIREIRNTAERIVLLETGDSVRAQHLVRLVGDRGEGDGIGAATASRPLLNLDEMEKNYIQEALLANKGNKTRAARQLGITRSALFYRMDKYGITAEVV